MDIQWYPGHMAKATRQIREELNKIDTVLLVGDARCVKSSINRDFLPVIGNKNVAYVFNKSDLADEKITEKWLHYFKTENTDVFFTDMMTKRGLDKLKDYIGNLHNSFRYNREARIMIAGIPNVGKSMVINALSGRAGAITGNTPGVTRANKWIKLEDNYYLLDTPGILPPKFTNEHSGTALAAIGCVKDTVFDKGELCLNVINFMSEKYPENLTARYKLSALAETPTEILEDIAAKRGFITKGGVTDYERCINIVLDEFKNGKIGRISFETPEENN